MDKMIDIRKNNILLILLSSFVLIITASRPQCTPQQLTSNTGTITTRNYPNSYPKEESCIWTITVDIGYYIELTFKDFDVEYYRDCKTDVLEVKDGGDKGAPLIGILDDRSPGLREKGGQYCNYRRPPTVITSTNNQLRLWFSSDSSIENRGFKASYKAVLDVNCGGHINAAHGEISTPRFPLHYPRKRQCEWKIKVPEGKYVALKFVFFEVETKCNRAGCKCLDWVKIKDGHSENAREIGEYCFVAPPPLVTSGNELSIAFSSDDYGRLKGFKAIFTQSSTEKCGGDLVSVNGTIESPKKQGDTTKYPHFSHCIWTIKARKNEYISLNFVYVDVISAQKNDCSSDFIEVRNGPDKGAPLLGRYCNMFLPEVIISTGQSLFVRFQSDAMGTGKGFKATYQSHTRACTSSLGIEDGRIQKYDMQTSSVFKIAHEPHALSANYGRLNGPYAWCSQEQRFSFVGEYFQVNFRVFTRITKIATQGYTMVGNFYYVTKYKIMYTMGGNKLQHYANLKDSEHGSLYTIFDGNRAWNVTKANEISPTVVVKSLRIVPLDYQSGRRRHICMRVEVYGCTIPSDGEVLTKQKETIKFKTNKKTSKTWLISPEGTNAVYIFKVIQLQSICGVSSLSLSYDGVKYAREKTYCKSFEKDVQIYPSSRQLWLKFDIHKLPSKFQGVQFKYSLQNLGHGRVITSQHGKIRCLHNVVVENNKTSVWLFTFPKGYRINLEFQKVQLPTSKINPMVIVKSGLEDSSPPIRKIEGRENSWGFVHYKNSLRIEYHVGMDDKGSPIKGGYGDGFILRYSAWTDGVKHNNNA